MGLSFGNFIDQDTAPYDDAALRLVRQSNPQPKFYPDAIFRIAQGTKSAPKAKPATSNMTPFSYGKLAPMMNSTTTNPLSFFDKALTGFSGSLGTSVDDVRGIEGVYDDLIHRVARNATPTVPNDTDGRSNNVSQLLSAGVASMANQGTGTTTSEQVIPASYGNGWQDHGLDPMIIAGVLAVAVGAVIYFTAK